MVYKVYAKINEDKNITRFFSTCFEQPEENDVFIKEGMGDEFVHVPQYDVYHENGSYKYKVIENEIYEIEPEEIEIPSETVTLEERVKQLESLIQQLSVR